jgi:hypothetical protein
MDGARFDRLAASWAKGHSRRGVLSLLAALALSGGLGQRHGAISAQGVDAEKGGVPGSLRSGTAVQARRLRRPLQQARHLLRRWQWRGPADVRSGRSQLRLCQAGFGWRLLPGRLREHLGRQWVHLRRLPA